MCERHFTNDEMAVIADGLTEAADVWEERAIAEKAAGYSIVGRGAEHPHIVRWITSGSKGGKCIVSARPELMGVVMPCSVPAKGEPWHGVSAHLAALA